MRPPPETTFNASELPAEIRVPQGTVAGVSSFRLSFAASS
jgi:hypothetical protein